MSAAVPASSSASVLNKLDGYMAAAGYDTDHPWRAEISEAVANLPSHGISANAPYSQAHIPFAEINDHIIMRSKQLAAILAVIPTAGYSPQMISLVGQMADNLVAEVRRADGGSPLAGQIASQLAELLLMIQGSQGPCDLLWLCQQIANELDETMSAMCEEEVEA